MDEQDHYALRATELLRRQGLHDRRGSGDLEASLAAQRAAADGNSEPGNVGFYNQHWLDSGTRVSTTGQTSLVVDPPDGRVPALTPAGQASAAIALETGQGVSGVDVSERRGTDGPEQRSLWERCVTRGLPRLPDFYNNNFLILQRQTTW